MIDAADSLRRDVRGKASGFPSNETEKHGARTTSMKSQESEEAAVSRR